MGNRKHALDLASRQKILRRFQSLNLKKNRFVLHISSDMMKTLCFFIGLAFLVIDIASGKTLSLARLDDAGDLLFELGNYLNQTDSRVDSVVEQIQTGFDALESKIDSLTADVSSLKAKVKSVKKKVDEDCCGDANCFNYRGTVAVTKKGKSVKIGEHNRQRLIHIHQTIGRPWISRDITTVGRSIAATRLLGASSRTNPLTMAGIGNGATFHNAECELKTSVCHQAKQNFDRQCLDLSP